MKKAKSLMLLTATILLLAVMFCMNASAAEWTTIDENIAYTFDAETGVTVVKGEGHLNTYHFGYRCYNHYTAALGCCDCTDREYDPPENWPGYEASQKTKTLIIQQGITSVDVRGFRMFENLEVVIFPESVTEIPAGAFSGLKKLNTVVLSGSTTSIDQAAFSGCSNLRNMYIPDTVKTIHASAFSGCDMSSIRIPESVKLAPTKVSKVTASSQTATAITLNWSKSERATGYRVYQKVSSGWKTLGTVNKLSGTVKNLKPGKLYTFVVRPYTKYADGEVVWGDYDKFSFETAPSSMPTVTAKATSDSKGKISLSWDKRGDMDCYQIWYKKNDGKYTLYKTVTASTNSMSFSNLKSGTKYTFAVRAGMRTNGGYFYGDYKAATVTVK